MTSEPRVALVTGAARGIGAATVRTLLDRGYRVAALDWCADNTISGLPYKQATRADLDSVVAAAGDRAEAMVADVRDPTALDHAVARTRERWGRVDVAVAAAAVILGGAPMWHTPPDVVETLWTIDVLGVWNTAAAAVPAMLAGPDPSGCRFVAVTSAAGANGVFGLAAYGMVKHAVVGMVKGLSADLTGTGVTACAVSPGATRTAMLEATAALYGHNEVNTFTDSVRIRRLLDPDEIAATIAYCCSPEGGIVNGTVIHADGGFDR